MTASSLSQDAASPAGAMDGVPAPFRDLDEYRRCCAAADDYLQPLRAIVLDPAEQVVIAPALRAAGARP